MDKMGFLKRIGINIVSVISFVIMFFVGLTVAGNAYWTQESVDYMAGDLFYILGLGTGAWCLAYIFKAAVVVCGGYEDGKDREFDKIKPVRAALFGFLLPAIIAMLSEDMPGEISFQGANHIDGYTVTLVIVVWAGWFLAKSFAIYLPNAILDVADTWGKHKRGELKKDLDREDLNGLVKVIHDNYGSKGILVLATSLMFVGCVLIGLFIVML